MRLPVVGIELDRFEESGAGEVVACEREVGAAHVVVSGGELRVDVYGFVVLLDRLLVLVARKIVETLLCVRKRLLLCGRDGAHNAGLRARDGCLRRQTRLILVLFKATTQSLCDRALGHPAPLLHQYPIGLHRIGAVALLHLHGRTRQQADETHKQRTIIEPRDCKPAGNGRRHHGCTSSGDRPANVEWTDKGGYLKRSWLYAEPRLYAESARRRPIISVAACASAEDSLRTGCCWRLTQHNNIFLCHRVLDATG